MSYFVCFKTTDSNREDFYLLTYTSGCLADIIVLADHMHEGLVVTQSNPTARNIQSLYVVDNKFERKTFADGIIDLMANSINEFEWKFVDRYGRTVRCYITSNV